MEDPILYTSLCLIIILIALKLSLQITKKPRYKNLPPSPPALPVIGHLHLLKHPIHRTLHRLSAEHGGGGGVLFLQMGTRRVVVVSAPSAVEECFTKNDIALANRPPLIMAKHLSYNRTTMVSAPYGDHWRNLRRVGAIEIFSSARLSSFLTTRRDEVKRLLLQINRASLLRGRVELKSAFSHLTFNIIMRMVAGKRYYGDDVVAEDGEARQFQELITEIFKNGGAGNPADFLPILNWAPQGYEKRIERLAKRTDKFLQRLIDEHRSRKESRNTMIDHLLSMQYSQPEYYTDQIIKGLVLIFLLGATDTSAMVLEWAMSNLLNHPEVLKKAKAEIDTRIGQHNLLEESSVPKLQYLQNIISETHRICPAAPLLLPHYSTENCDIGGYNVPHDTILLVNAWAIHRDPKLWDEPESFKPERFEKSGSDDHDQQNGYKLMPFGLGRRACPGVGLAQRVVGLTLGSLIQCFEWERVGEELVDMTEGKGLTMPKAVPLEAICKARPIMNTVELSVSVDGI